VTGLWRIARGFAVFWWDFLIGDDWRVAAGVILALAGTAALAAADQPAWWLPPAAVLMLLTGSLWAATRKTPH
jgi:hypothetical protein